MNTPADRLRTAVLQPRPAPRRTPRSLEELARELDQTFAEQEFDREPRHTAECDFAPTSELANDELVALVIPPEPKRLTSWEELDRQLSKPSEVDPAYLNYEVKSIY